MDVLSSLLFTFCIHLDNGKVVEENNRQIRGLQEQYTILKKVSQESDSSRLKFHNSPKKIMTTSWHR